MITVINDNSKNLFYTKCKTCRSELSYTFKDVCFEEIKYSLTPNKIITCPVCGNKTYAELCIKENYNENQLPFTPYLTNSCCGGTDE